MRAEGNKITAEGGVLLSKLAVFAKENGLSGLEFAHGIPGSVGGGVCMNAGAYGGEMADVVSKVTFLTESGDIVEVKGEECGFAYRKSAFSDGGKFVLEAEFSLKEGEKETISSLMEDLIIRRREKQPLEYPSAGSTFKRPAGHYAAALIEQCGLKGLRVGGAQVSEKHAGFIINLGGATCEDVLALMGQVQKRVFSDTGVVLESEVKVIGV
jgi:UDP-N-acetylmuramate dehydrogenase